MKNYDLLWAREFAGLTQQQAANKIGVARYTYIRWETGQIAIPQVKWSLFLEALALTRDQIPKHLAPTPTAPPVDSKQALSLMGAPVAKWRDPQKIREEWQLAAEKHKARRVCIGHSVKDDPILSGLEHDCYELELEFYTARDGDMCAVEGYKRTRTPNCGAPKFSIWQEKPRFVTPEAYLEGIGCEEMDWPEAAVDVFREHYGLDLA